MRGISEYKNPEEAGQSLQKCIDSKAKRLIPSYVHRQVTNLPGSNCRDASIEVRTSFRGRSFLLFYDSVFPSLPRIFNADAALKGESVTAVLTTSTSQGTKTIVMEHFLKTHFSLAKLLAEFNVTTS